MTIIFLNRFFYPDHSATSQMLSDLAFALARSGHDVHIITSRQRYDAPDHRLQATNMIDGVRVNRVWTSRFGRHNLAGRALDYATFYITAALMLFRMARKGDIVVAKTDPPMLSLVTAPVAALRGAVSVNWLQDIFPEVAEELGSGTGLIGKIVFGLVRPLRNLTFRRAARNVVIGQQMASRLLALGVPSERIKVIPNWADGSLISPIPRSANPLRADWGLAQKFVVGYSGNLGRAHDIATFVEAIARIEALAKDEAVTAARSTARSVAWLFVGGGAQIVALQQQILARGLTSVCFQPYQPREWLAESLSAPDIHLISLRPQLEGLIVPSKYYGVAAAGRPAIFIGAADGEIGSLLARSKTGCVVAEGDSARLVSTVLAYACDMARAQSEGQMARALFDAHFDKKGAVLAWQDVIKDLERPSQPHRPR